MAICRIRSVNLGLLVFGWIAACGISAFGQLSHPIVPRPSFEVSAIKPSDPNPKGPTRFGGVLARDCRLSAKSVSVEKLIEWAYGVPAGIEGEVLGGSGWISTNLYDVEAKADDASGCQKLQVLQQLQDMRWMMQSLLAERFKLKTHFETKELPVFLLVVAKGGPKLTSVAAPPPPDGGPRSAAKDGGPPPGAAGISAHGGTTQMNANALLLSDANSSVTSLTHLLQSLPELGGRTVVDRTGLTKNYSFSMQWSTEQPGAAAVLDGPSLFTAMEEQLGLKLEAGKAPVEVLVIDQIDRPSEN